MNTTRVGGPETARLTVWRRARNASNVRIPGAGHLVRVITVFCVFPSDLSSYPRLSRKNLEKPVSKRTLFTVLFLTLYLPAEDIALFLNHKFGATAKDTRQSKL